MRRRTRAWIPLAAVAVLAGCASQPPPPSTSEETPLPAQYVVDGGTASALSRFPRGTVVPATSPVCLRAGETLTLAHPVTGARITYGEGCERRVPEPDAGG